MIVLTAKREEAMQEGYLNLNLNIMLFPHLRTSTNTAHLFKCRSSLELRVSLSQELE